MVALGTALMLGLWASCGGDDDVTPGDGGDGEAGKPCTRTDDCDPGFLCDGTDHCTMVLPTLAETGAQMTGCTPPPTPTGGTVTATIFVEDFEDSVGVEGATIDLFLDNVVDDTIDAVVGPSDAGGLIAGIANLPALGVIAYRVHTGTLPAGEVRTTIEYDVEIPETDGDQVRVLSVSGATYSLIQSILGIRPDPALGVIAGSFSDCAGNSVEGIVVRLLDAAGEDCHVLDDLQCYSRYFREEFPARIENQTFSSADGLFGIVQVPPGEWTIEVRGRLTAGSPGFPYDLVGRKVVRPAANAIVIVDVNPLAS